MEKSQNCLPSWTPIKHRFCVVHGPVGSVEGNECVFALYRTICQSDITVCTFLLTGVTSYSIVCPSIVGHSPTMSTLSIAYFPLKNLNKFSQRICFKAYYEPKF